MFRRSSGMHQENSCLPPLVTLAHDGLRNRRTVLGKIASCSSRVPLVAAARLPRGAVYRRSQSCGFVHLIRRGAELLWPRSVLSASVSSGPTTVDVEDLARDECGPFEIQDRVDDVADFAEPAKGVEFGHPLIG